MSGNPKVILGSIKKAIATKSKGGLPKRTKKYSKLNRVLDAIDSEMWEVATAYFEDLQKDQLNQVVPSQKQINAYLKKHGVIYDKV